MQALINTYFSKWQRSMCGHIWWPNNTALLSPMVGHTRSVFSIEVCWINLNQIFSFIIYTKLLYICWCPGVWWELNYPCRPQLLLANVCLPGKHNQAYVSQGLLRNVSWHCNPVLNNLLMRCCRSNWHFNSLIIHTVTPALEQPHSASCAHKKHHQYLHHLFDFCLNTVKPVCNDHLYNKMYYLWFIQ